MSSDIFFGIWNSVDGFWIFRALGVREINGKEYVDEIESEQQEARDLLHIERASVNAVCS